MIYVPHFYVSLLNHEPHFYTSFLIQEPFSFRFFSISFLKWFDINQTCHDSGFACRFQLKKSHHLLDCSPLPKWFDINQTYRDSPKLHGYPSEKMGTRGPMGSRGSVSERFRGPRCTRESGIFGRERGTTNTGGSIQGRSRFRAKGGGKASNRVHG